MMAKLTESDKKQLEKAKTASTPANGKRPRIKGKSKMNDKIVNNRVDWSDTKYYCNNIIEHASSLIDIAKKLTNDEYENLQHKEQAQEALKNFVDKFVKEKIPTGLSVINSFANLNHNDIRIEVLFSNLTNVEIHIDINKGELYFKVKEHDR